MDLLLNAYDDESKSYMTARQLRDEITTIFMAGHETTAQTLSWIFYQLATNETVYDKIRIETSALASAPLTIDSLQQLTYTKTVIEETMRLYPPVWIMSRKSIANDQVNGYFIPGGSTILVNIYGMNHHPGYWNTPETFLPERFDPVNKEKPHPFLYLPFGGGQRLCIGNLFAMMVMQTVVVRLVQEFKFKISPVFKPIVQPSITLRAKDGILLLIDQHTPAKTDVYANDD